MKPIIAGLAFIGGILVLLMASDEDEEGKDPNDKSNKSSEDDKVDVEKIRTLRRELRHQLSKKKKTSNKPPTKQ